MVELMAAIARAQAEMKAATMDKVNPHFQSRYATLAAVIDAVREPLTKHGVAFVQRVHQVDAGVGIETVFLGHGAEFSTGVLVVPVDKRTAQGMGSALTYARRYSLSMACCISAEEDDDGNAAEANAPSKPATITTEQLAPLQDAIEAAAMTAEKFCTAYGIASLTALPADRYESAMKRLADRAAKLRPAA